MLTEERYGPRYWSKILFSAGVEDDAAVACEEEKYLYRGRMISFVVEIVRGYYIRINSLFNIPSICAQVLQICMLVTCDNALETKDTYFSSNGVFGLCKADKL